jgi:DNA-binding NtrC family response regulator
VPEELRGPCLIAEPPSPRPSTGTLPASAQPIEREPLESELPLRKRLQQHEADLIRRALGQAEGNRTHAAQLLRMPLRTFMKRLGEYGSSSPAGSRRRRRLSGVPCRTRWQ